MDRAGPRLREIRLAQGLSLSDVASRAGVTKGFLSQAERGLTRVSVPTLLGICAALDTTIGALFDYPDETVVGAGVPVQMGGLGVVEYLLTPADQEHLQSMRTLIAPGGGSGGSYRLDSEAVFAHVLRGTLEVTVDGVTRVLYAGDSTTYPARSDHAWVNPTDGETEVLFVFAPPLPGRRTGQSREPPRTGLEYQQG
jgi:transcriptional regulator with XRE-family HTH domain